MNFPFCTEYVLLLPTTTPFSKLNNMATLQTKATGSYVKDTIEQEIVCISNKITITVKDFRSLEGEIIQTKTIIIIIFIFLL